MLKNLRDVVPERLEPVRRYEQGEQDVLALLQEGNLQQKACATLYVEGFEARVPRSANCRKNWPLIPTRSYAALRAADLD